MPPVSSGTDARPWFWYLSATEQSPAHHFPLEPNQPRGTSATRQNLLRRLTFHQTPYLASWPVQRYLHPANKMVPAVSSLIRAFSHGARWQPPDYKLVIYLIHSCDLEKDAAPLQLASFTVWGVVPNLPPQDCSNNFTVIWEQIGLQIEGGEFHQITLLHYRFAGTWIVSSFCFVDIQFTLNLSYSNDFAAFVPQENEIWQNNLFLQKHFKPPQSFLLQSSVLHKQFVKRRS